VQFARWFQPDQACLNEDFQLSLLCNHLLTLPDIASLLPDVSMNICNIYVICPYFLFQPFSNVAAETGYTLFSVVRHLRPREILSFCLYFCLHNFQLICMNNLHKLTDLQCGTITFEAFPWFRARSYRKFP
jgi:hypothetical protein